MKTKLSKILLILLIGSLIAITVVHFSPIARVREVDIIDTSGIAVVTGGNTSFVIMADGSLWGWGRNEYGQLGDGTTEGRFSPVWIMGDVVAVASSDTHTVAIKADGTLWGWGSGRHGQLGDNTQQGIPGDRLYPELLLDFVDSFSPVVLNTMAHVAADEDVRPPSLG